MITLVFMRGEPRTALRAPDGMDYPSEGAFARAMIGQGMDPETVLVVHDRNARAITNPLPLRYWAARIVVEDDRGIRQAWWAPHPKGNYPDALLAWHAETASQREAARVVAGKGRKAQAVAA